MIDYNKLFDVAYSTSIPESVKETIFEKLEVPVMESEEISEEVLYYVNFLDKMAYSDMSESLTDEIIERVMGNLDEAFVEEIYEEYIRLKSLGYINEADLPVGLTGLKKMQDADRDAKYDAFRKKFQQSLDRRAKEQARAQTINNIKTGVGNAANKAKEGIKGAFNSAKGALAAAGNKAAELGKSAVNATATAANNAKNAATSTAQNVANKATEVGTNIKNKAAEIGANAKNAAVEAGNKIKAATEPARDVASYTAHKAAEGGKSVLDKVKGAVGKVKNWWNDYKAKAKAYGDTKRQEAQDREDEKFLAKRDGESSKDYKARVQGSGKYGWAYPAEVGAKQGRYMRLDKLNALRKGSGASSIANDAANKKEKVAK